MSKDLINIFREAVENPGTEARKWKEENKGQVVGFLLTDVPEELIHAAGCFPYGISGSSDVKLDAVDAHLQFWTCSFVRSSFALALEGKLDFLDGLVIPQTCDTTRMVVGIWKHASPLPLIELFRLPRQERPSASKFFFNEINRVKERLEELSGVEITPDRLRRSIELYNHNRSLLRQLYAIHEQNPRAISNRDLYTVINASMLFPREKLNELLTELVDQLKSEELSSTKDENIRIFISGTLAAPLEIMDYIEEQNGVVVGDDLKNGYRYVEADVDENLDPLEALAERQLNRIPSASYYFARNPRPKFLVQAAREKGVQGVILLHLKYCEPENFDYYDNALALNGAGITSLKVETEFGKAALGQLRTRINAFMEMVGGEQ